MKISHIVLPLTPWKKIKLNPFVCSLSSKRNSSTNTERIIKAPYPKINIPTALLHDYVWKDINKWNDKTALVCSNTEQSYTYSEAKEKSHELAVMFQTILNLPQKAAVAILLPNCIDYPLLLLASSEAGVITTTINPQYTSDEIAKQLKDSNAKAIITISARFDAVKDAVQKAGIEIPIVLMSDNVSNNAPSGSIPIEEALKSCKHKPLTPSKENCYDCVVLPYSSGTTGLPKGVQLTHNNLVANLKQIDQPGIRLIKQTSATEQDSVLGLLPMFHIYGMTVVTFSTMMSGGKLIVIPQFEPSSFISTIVKQQISLMYLVPPLIIFLGSHPNVKSEFLTSVRAINSGAAPIGHKDVERLKSKAPQISIYQGYGMTETSPVTFITHHDRMQKFASCGSPVPNTEAKVTDVETGEPLAAYKTGELRIKGPQCMPGYLNKPSETKDIFDDEGFLKTGDLAYYDDDGDFFIVDRLKELIKVKGFQVAPAELEEVLRHHPSVLDAAVIGVKDERAGEVPKGFIVLKPGVSATADDIHEYVNKQVAEYKKLAGGLVFLKEIPKSAAGKILRKNLK